MVNDWHLSARLSFEGLLFEGNTKNKSWTLVCQGTVTMTIRPPGGGARGDAWSMVASQEAETVSTWSKEGVMICLWSILIGMGM